jgi:hypothetical protein
MWFIMFTIFGRHIFFITPWKHFKQTRFKSPNREIMWAIITRNKSTHQYFQAQRHVTLFGSRMHHLNPLQTNQKYKQKTWFLKCVNWWSFEDCIGVRCSCMWFDTWSC